MFFLVILGLMLVFISVIVAGYRRNEPKEKLPNKVLVGAIVAVLATVMVFLAAPTAQNNQKGCPSGTNLFTGLKRDTPYILLADTKTKEYNYSLVYLKTDNDTPVVQCVATSSPLPKLFSVGTNGSIISLEKAAAQ